MEIPEGFSMQDEHDAIKKLQWREDKALIIDWLMSLSDWKVKADLTYATIAAPEQVEKRVRWWLKQVAPGCRAIAGIEYQSRGSAHAHVIVDEFIDFKTARTLWMDGAGFCWLQAIRNGPRALGYAIKDAVKRGEVNIYGPGTQRGFSTTPYKRNHKQHRAPGMNPNEYEAEAFAKLIGNRAGKLA